MSYKQSMRMPGLGSVPAHDVISDLKKSFLSEIVQIYKSHRQQFDHAISFIGLGRFETENLIRLRTDFVTLETIYLMGDVLKKVQNNEPLDPDYLSSSPLLDTKRAIVNFILNGKTGNDEATERLGFNLNDLREVSKTTALNFYTMDQLIILALLKSNEMWPYSLLKAGAL